MKRGILNLVDVSRMLFDEGICRLTHCLTRPMHVQRDAPSVHKLEDRLMFSATPLAGNIDLSHAMGELCDTAGCETVQVAELLTGHTDDSTTAEPFDQKQVTSRQLVIVDGSVSDIEAFFDELSLSEIPAEVFVLDSHADGIAQISQILEGRHDLTAIHLVSHGGDGEISLGNSVLNRQSMETHAGQIALWSNSLADNADLLIYGCDLASGDAGIELIESLQALTGADVAASDDLTGHESLGGDWELEVHRGIIETEVFVSDALQADWRHTLETIQVTQLLDVVNGDTSSVAALLASDGGDGISLREAILAANTNEDLDTLQLTAGTYSLSLNGSDDNATAGDLDILEDLAIYGEGPGVTVISASSIADRVFHLMNEANVVMEGITITGGSGGTGAGIYIDGAETLLLNRSEIVGNNASGNDGGGLSNRNGIVTLNEVTISGNQAAGKDGGGILNEGLMTLNDVIVSGNSAAGGGGGGIYNKGELTANRVTIADNIARDGGGVVSRTAGSSLALNNVTISQNSATNKGGGLESNRDVMIVNSTIAFNQGGSGGGLNVSGNGISLLNTILANNTLTNGTTSSNVSGNVQSLGHNIDSDGTAGLSQTGDQSNVDPLLSPLADNGGYVQTHALQVGSPALNAGTSSGAMIVDARGLTSVDGRIDVGAYQANAVDVNRIYWADNVAEKIYSSNLDGSDRQELAIANLNDPDEIFVDSINLKIYWSQSSDGKIRRADLDGANAEDVLTGLNAPQDFEIDLLNEKIYWAEDALVTNQIVRANLDGSDRQVLYSGFLTQGPEHLTLDLERGKLYWTDNITRQIQRMNLDGTGRETVTTTQHAVQAIAIDSRTNELYYSAIHLLGDDDRIYVRNLDTNVETIFFETEGAINLVAPDDLAIDYANDQLLWTDYEQRQIGRVSFAGNNASAIDLGGTDRPKSLALGTSAAAMPNRNPVANAGGPYTIDEGEPLTLDGSSSTDADGDLLTYHWDIDNDGNFEEAGEPSGVDPTLDWVSLEGFGIDDDGTYTVRLRVTDPSGATSFTSATVNIANVLPTFTSTSTFSVSENSNDVGVIEATDPVDSVTYSVSGGVDRDRFTIHATTGQLAFIAAPDFEAPDDADSDHVYQVIVTATDDDGGTQSATLSISVTDNNDNAPQIDPGQHFIVSETANNGASLGVVSASDVDTGSTLSNWTVVSGNDDGVFAIDAASGNLYVLNNATLDDLATPSYSLGVTVSDGVHPSNVQTITVDVIVAPDPLSSNDTYSVSEGGTLSVDAIHDWHNVSWRQRQRLTFDNADGTADLVDQAIRIRLHATAADAVQIDYNATQNQGEDLRFYDSDGSLLAHEIESWDESGYSTVWVRVPQIDAHSTGDFVWMYYDNASFTGSNDPSTVWADDAVVLHFENSLQDSTANANHGGGPVNFATGGPFGSAGLFDGATSRVSLGSDSSLDDTFAGGGTVSAWINADGWGGGNYGRIADKSNSTFGGATPNGDGWAFEVGRGSGNAGFLLFNHGFSGREGDWRTPTGSIQLDTWHHVAVVYDSSSSSNVPQIYIDGQLQTVTAVKSPLGNARSDADMELVVGGYPLANSRVFDGRIDEVRITKDATSAAEIKAQYAQGASGFVAGSIAESGPGGIMRNDQDPSGLAITVGLHSGPSHAASFSLQADGSFHYVHDGGETTVDSFEYALTNAAGSQSIATVFINITPVNDAPVADAGGSYVIDEASALNLNGSLSSDAEGSTLQYQWDLNRNGIFGDAGDASGQRPAVSWAALNAAGITNNGNYSIVLQVTDAAGATSTSTATLTINNVAPVARDDTGTGFRTDEDTRLVISGLLANDTDVNAFDPLTIRSFNTTMTTGLVTSNGDGTFTYDPNGNFEHLSAGQVAVDRFTYTIDDGDSGTSTATVSVEVVGVNDAPIITMRTSPLVYTENQSPVAVVDLLTLSDVDSSRLQSARIWFASGYQAGEDGVEFVGTDQIDVQWDAETSTLTLMGEASLAEYKTVMESVRFWNQSETPSTEVRTLRVEVSDELSQSVVATRSIEVISVNDTPVAGSDSFDVVAGESLNGSGILLNDVDADGQPLTATLVSGPSHGTLTLQSDGSFVYQPNVEFAGVDQFVYVVSDGSATSEPQTVLLNVAVANLSANTSNPGTGDGGSTETASSTSSTEGGVESDVAPPTDAVIAAGNHEQGSATDSTTAPTSNVGDIEILQTAVAIDDDEAAFVNVLLNTENAFEWHSKAERSAIVINHEILRFELESQQSIALDAVVSAAQYEYINQPGAAWIEMDAFRSQIGDQLFGSAVTTATVGITSSGFAIGYITWMLRSGFVLTGLLANMPIWRSFDPLIVISGMSTQAGGETIQQIIRDEKRNLDTSRADSSDSAL
ncbi:MAG: DUF2341 domain-containing protein [Pirellulaceae bacterium]